MQKPCMAMVPRKGLGVGITFPIVRGGKLGGVSGGPRGPQGYLRNAG